jgi:hypothetical protein
MTEETDQTPRYASKSLSPTMLVEGVEGYAQYSKVPGNVRPLAHGLTSLLKTP